MSGHLLDTSVVQQFIHPKAAAEWPNLVAAVESIGATDGSMHLAVVTAFEIRRGLRELELRGKGSRKRRLAELFLRKAVLLAPRNMWDVAAELWAQGRVHKPAIKLSDGDLLIASVAMATERTLVTADAKLAANLEAIGLGKVQCLAVARVSEG